MIQENTSPAAELALASVTALLIERLSAANPELRIIAAQAVENAARILEEFGAHEKDPVRKDLWGDAVLEVEKIHALAFGHHSSHRH